MPGFVTSGYILSVSSGFSSSGASSSYIEGEADKMIASFLQVFIVGLALLVPFVVVPLFGSMIFVSVLLYYYIFAYLTLWYLFDRGRKKIQQNQIEKTATASKRARPLCFKNDRVNMKYIGIFFAITGIIATIVYGLESIITQDIYSYQWLISVVLILFVCAYLFARQRAV